MMARLSERILAVTSAAETAAGERADAARAAGRRILGAASEAGAAGVPAIKAAGEAGSAVVDGMTKVHRRAADFVANRIRQEIEAQRELFACRTLEDVREMQSRYFKTALDQYATEAKEMLNLSGELATRALDPKKD